jgi:drug/metabolite transporter (DMT)-like permease
MKKILGFISLFIAAVTFGSFGIWIRLLNREMSIYQQLVLRNAFAFIITIFIVLLTKQLKNIEWNKVKKPNLVFYTFLALLAGIAYNFSIINTKIALATFAFYLGTILTGWVAGFLFYKEKLNAEKWLSLIFVLIGLGLFAYPFTNSSINLGFITGIVSGVLDGSANGFGKDFAGKISKSVLVLLTTIGSILVNSLMIAYFHQGSNYVATMSTTAWVVVAFLGCLVVILSYLLLVGFQNFDLSSGSIVLSLELLFALIFGILVFQEYPTGKELLGGLFILVANIVPNLKMLLTNRFSKLLDKAGASSR